MTACFRSFDEDGSGAISLPEIKEVIGKLVHVKDHIW